MSLLLYRATQCHVLEHQDFGYSNFYTWRHNAQPTGTSLGNVHSAAQISGTARSSCVFCAVLETAVAVHVVKCCWTWLSNRVLVMYRNWLSVTLWLNVVEGERDRQLECLLENSTEWNWVFLKKLIMVSLRFMKPKSPPLGLTIQIFFSFN